MIKFRKNIVAVYYYSWFMLKTVAIYNKLNAYENFKFYLLLSVNINEWIYY